jgi:hypothetical protein
MGLNAAAIQRPIILADSSGACRKQCNSDKIQCDGAAVYASDADIAKNRRACDENYRACVSSCRGD